MEMRRMPYADRPASFSYVNFLVTVMNSVNEGGGIAPWARIAGNEAKRPDTGCLKMMPHIGKNTGDLGIQARAG